MVNIFRILREKKEAMKKEQFKKARAELGRAKLVAADRKALAKERAELQKIKAETRSLKGPSVSDRLRAGFKEARKQGYISGKPGGAFAVQEKSNSVLGETRNIWDEPKKIIKKTKKRKQIVINL